MIDQFTCRAIAARLAVTGFIVGAFDRIDRNDRGQGSVEYVGIILVVVGIIAAVLLKQTEIGNAIGQKILDAVKKIG
jgi:hypothetical protein